MIWLRQSGVIVLGELGDREHLELSLKTNAAAEQWLASVPPEQRATVFAEVCRTLSAAGVDIKHILVRARADALKKGHHDTPGIHHGEGSGGHPALRPRHGLAEDSPQ